MLCKWAYIHLAIPQKGKSHIHFYLTQTHWALNCMRYLRGIHLSHIYSHIPLLRTCKQSVSDCMWRLTRVLWLLRRQQTRPPNYVRLDVSSSARCSRRLYLAFLSESNRPLGLESLLQVMSAGLCQNLERVKSISNTISSVMQWKNRRLLKDTAQYREHFCCTEQF